MARRSPALLAAAALVVVVAALSAPAVLAAAAAPAKNATAAALPVVAPVVAPTATTTVMAPKMAAVVATPAKNAAVVAPVVAAPAKNAAAAAPVVAAAAPAKKNAAAAVAPVVAPAVAAAAAPAKKNAAAVVAPVVVAAPPVTVDCAAVLHDASVACKTELRLLDAGVSRLSSATTKCCAAAAKLYSPAFASACACKPEVARVSARLSAGRAAAQGACSALKTTAAAIPACPSALLASTPARNGLPADPPPAWGTGSVCYSVAKPTTGRNSPCTKRCTSTSTPTDAQLASAMKCAVKSKGYCEGLGVDGAPTGITTCGKGVAVADGSRGQKCFLCCTVRLEKTGRAAAKNACVNPAGGGGGGGGGGGCFPGDATTVLESTGKPVALRDLKVGDRVLSADPKTGAASFQDVYFFGHMVPEAAGEFVRVEADGGRVAMELTPKHLLPVLPGPVYKRAQDVVAGDVVMVVAAGEAAAREAEVTRVSGVVRASGLYQPLTAGGGHVVVDGVLASVHSDWLLDPLFEAVGRVGALHAAYERTHGALLQLAYRALGAGPMQRMAPVVSALANGHAPVKAAAGGAAVRALAASTAAPARKA